MEVTSDAITDALLSSTPRHRYVVATVSGLSAQVYAYLAWFMPTPVLDAILMKNYAKYV
jgi:hypothetical protein